MVRDKTPAAASCDTSALQRNVDFGKKYKITGTPTLIFADGTRVPGAIAAPRMSKNAWPTQAKLAATDARPYRPWPPHAPPPPLRCTTASKPRTCTPTCSTSRSPSPGLHAQQALALPVWIPGSYLVREFSKNLQNLQAQPGQARRWHCSNSTRHRWHGDCQPGKPLVLQLRGLRL